MEGQNVTEEAQMKACPFCGEKIMAEAKKCKHCGEFVDPLLLRATSTNNSPGIVIQNQNVQGGNSELSEKSRFVYVLLDLFLGPLGVHNMYAGFIGTGILQLILSLTLVGLIITVPWCILELFIQTKDASGRRMR